MACNSMYQMAQWIQLNLFPSTYFDLVTADAGEEAGWNYPYHTDGLIPLKLGTHTKQFKKKIFLNTT